MLCELSTHAEQIHIVLIVSEGKTMSFAYRSQCNYTSSQSSLYQVKHLYCFIEVTMTVVIQSIVSFLFSFSFLFDCRGHTYSAVIMLTGNLYMIFFPCICLVGNLLG